jgi:hypothetical protein
MSSSSASVREPHAQSARSQSRTARPQHRRLIAGVQALFFIFGLLFLMMGGIRVFLEFNGNLKDTVAEFSSNENMVATPTFVVGILMALLGYGLLWGVAALGAKEPPAWHTGRNGLIGIIAMLMIMMVVAAWLNLSWLIFMLPIAVVFGGIAMFLVMSFSQPSVRLALGADRLQKREATRFNWIRNGLVVLVLSTMAVLGGVYAVLTDIIELPLQDVEPGEFIYVTTFDDYNDEWDIYTGRNSYEIVTDESGNQQLIFYIDSGQRSDGVFSTLNRKLRNFDLRVTTTQITSDDLHDNRYGVVFRYRDTNNYYGFEVSGDGWYQLVKVEEGHVTEISTWVSTTRATRENILAAFDEWIATTGMDDAQFQEIISNWVIASSGEISDNTIQMLGEWLSPSAGVSSIELARAWITDPDNRIRANEMKMIQGWIEVSGADTHLLEFPTVIRPGSYNIIDDPIETMNEIRVVGYEDKFWFYINGQRLALCQRGDNKESTFTGGECISDELTYYYQDDTFKQGRIGLGAGYTENSDLIVPITIAFDNVTIVGPDPATLNFTTNEDSENVAESAN